MAPDGWFFGESQHEETGEIIVVSVRLTWSQVRKLITALTTREKEEKNKTEDWESDE